jgi:hypothetical protein
MCYVLGTRIRRMAAIAAIVFICSLFGVAADARAQDGPSCRFLCSPGLNVEPTITVEHLFKAPRVSEGGTAPERLKRERVFEMVFALDVPTRFERLGFTFEAIVAPFGRTSEHPFTGRSAAALGGDIRDNPIQLESELNLVWLPGRLTREWVESHFDVVDQFSPAARPGDRSVYTHKLDFELDTSVAVFKWLPDGHWLRNVEIEGSLDYLATGLPKAGDEVPPGGERFVDDASPWSFSVVFIVPVISPR